MIYNSDTNMVYVGETSNLKKRSLHHYNCLKNGTHSNNQLLNDYKLGHCLFFSVLEEFEEPKTKEELKLLEKMYIMAFYNRGMKLYNKTTKEYTKESLYFEFIDPKVKNINYKLRNKFGMELNSIRYCKTNKLMDVFRGNNK